MAEKKMGPMEAKASIKKANYQEIDVDLKPLMLKVHGLCPFMLSPFTICPLMKKAVKSHFRLKEMVKNTFITATWKETATI